MGQILKPEKITNLSESGGTITLAAGAVLNIGGQQFTTSSALNVAANLSSANTRYQIYAVLNSGVVELVVSANENSVGPAGATAWKLVGSYYTNGLPSIGFGSFVNIEGVPKTDPIEYLPNSSFGTNVTNIEGWWIRDGKIAHVRSYMIFGGISDTTQFRISAPTNLGGFDTSNQFESQFDNHGYCHVFDNAGQLDLSGAVENFNSDNVTTRKAEDSNSLFGNNLASGDRLALNYARPMVNLTNIAIKDL